jgi:hypothetical protein
MSHYEALARVLEPFLYVDRVDVYDMSPQERLRWARRFLD